MITEVVLVRHGRTGYNVIHRLQGQIDIPLDIVGQWQADQTGMALAKRYYWAKVSDIATHPERLVEHGAAADGQADHSLWQHAPAAARRLRVVSSDLIRAVQTAHAFADILGLPVETNPALRERSFGQWEGHTREEIDQMDHEAYVSWKSHMGGEAKYGVESRQACGTRGAQALIEYLEADAQNPTPCTLVVFGHGSWIASTIEHCIGLEHDSNNGIGGVRNASWSRLTPYQRNNVWCWRLEDFNVNPVSLQGELDSEWDRGPSWVQSSDMDQWTPFTY